MSAGACGNTEPSVHAQAAGQRLALATSTERLAAAASVARRQVFQHVAAASAYVAESCHAGLGSQFSEGREPRISFFLLATLTLPLNCGSELLAIPFTL